MAFLHTDQAGGIATFVGVTRRWTKERETVWLDYDAYPAMAEAELRRLVEEAACQWPIKKACVLHRLGVVPPGEASVFVGVATPHRADAFAACRFLIDELKRTVPIWKREHFADGTKEWMGGVDEQRSTAQQERRIP